MPRFGGARQRGLCERLSEAETVPVTADEHLHDALTGQHLTFLQSAQDTGGELLRLQVRLDPGGWVPRHVHARQDEHVEVVAGSLAIRVSGKDRTLAVGESADVPRRKVHVVRNAGEGEARFLLEVRPARRMEAAMRALFRVLGLLRPLGRLRRRSRP
jgi:quercetin dioxygenase-like cupin family protein